MSDFEKFMYYLVNVFTFGALFFVKLPYKKALDEVMSKQ